MEFRFSEDDRQFRSELTTFLDDQLPEGWWGEEAYDDSVWPFTLEMRKKLGEKGWLAISWPKEYGGQDASPGQSMIYSEEMAYNRAPGKDIQGVGFIGPCLMIHGTEEQKRQHLLPISEGKVTLVPGLQRAGIGLRPGFPPDPSSRGRRRLRDIRAEDLVQRRSSVGLVPPSRPH